jgi:hypothetical protein
MSDGLRHLLESQVADKWAGAVCHPQHGNQPSIAAKQADTHATQNTFAGHSGHHSSVPL